MMRSLFAGVAGLGVVGAAAGLAGAWAVAGALRFFFKKSKIPMVESSFSLL